MAVGLHLAGIGSAVSGWDALRLIDARAAAGSPPDTPVLVLSPLGDNRLIGGVRIRPTRRLYERRRVFADGEVLVLASAARAVADTALSEQSLRAVRATITSAVQRGLCSPSELLDELVNCPRGGSGFLRRALADAVAGAASVAEAEALDELRCADVPAFELNVALVRADGVLVAIADVLWRELRAVLEVDSREYHYSEREWNQTMTRHNRLTSAGMAVTHYSPSRIRAGGLRDDVPKWLRARAAELGVGYRVGAGALLRVDGNPPPFILR